MFEVFAWRCFGGVFQGRHFAFSLAATVTRCAIAMSQRFSRVNHPMERAGY